MLAPNETVFYLLLDEEWASSGLNGRRLRRCWVGWQPRWRRRRSRTKGPTKWSECVLSSSVYIINQADWQSTDTFRPYWEWHRAENLAKDLEYDPLFGHDFLLRNFRPQNLFGLQATSYTYTAPRSRDKCSSLKLSTSFQFLLRSCGP